MDNERQSRKTMQNLEKLFDFLLFPENSQPQFYIL